MATFGLGRRSRRRYSSPEGISLTAAGQRVRHADVDSMRRLAQPWQSRSFGYYDLLGEIKYAAQFYSRMLSPLRLYAAETDEAGDLVESEDEVAIAALERIQDPGGGRTGLLGSYGRLMFLTGEANLFVSKDKDTGEEQWEMLSSDEIRYQSGLYMRVMAPSLLAEEYKEPSDDDFEPVNDESAIAYRLWQRHPRYSSLADCTMQGVLDICEEIVLLTRAVRARTRSRTAGNGILFIDDRISPAPLEPTADEDALADPFLKSLVTAMMTPIGDEGSASAVVPLLVRVSVPEQMALADMVKHLQLVDPTQLYPETGLRIELIRRLSIGLDMPPEVLIGMTEANHWSAWQIDEQTWKGHGQPKAQQLVDDLTAAYYRPALRQAGVEDWRRFSIGYDASAIINHPDRTKDAKDLYDRAALSKRALREASGFPEEDAPSEAERAEKLGVLTHDSSLAWYGIPAPRGGNIEPQAGVITSVDGTGGGGGAGGGAEVEPGPPAGDGSEPPISTVGSGGNGHLNALVLATRISGAADMAVCRAREAAGNRLRSLAKRDKECAKLLEDVRVAQSAAALGPERVRLLGTNETELIAGAATLIADALYIMGIHDPELAIVIAKTVESHAIRTLYEEQPSPLPTTFTNYVVGLTSG